MLTAISYPVLIYAGLTLVRPRTLAIILAVLLLAHGVATWRQRGLAQVSRLVLLPVVVALNGGVTLWLALGATLAWWTFYTGVVSYALLGILFAAELVYRYWRFRPYDGSLTDPLFRGIFPPREQG